MPTISPSTCWKLSSVEKLWATAPYITSFFSSFSGYDSKAISFRFSTSSSVMQPASSPRGTLPLALSCFT